MKLYRNHKTLTIKDTILLRQYIERLRKQKRRERIAIGIGTLCLSAAFVSAVRLCSLNENDEFSASAVSYLNPTPIILQDTSVPDAEIDMIETKSEIEQYFDYYCSIYQVDKDIVYQKAKELTDTFTNTSWVLDYNIPGTRVIRQERSYDSPELGILAFIRHMKQIPTDFGLTKEELATNQTYSLDVTYEEFTEKQCRLFSNLDSTLCQAIQYHETGYYTSDVFLKYHNPAGLIDGNDYWQFHNPAEGILEFLFQLEYNYYNKNEMKNLSIEEQIIQIQPMFCPLTDKRDTLNLNKNWIPGVTDMYHQLSSEKQMSSNAK